MEINVEETKVKIISRQPSVLEIMTDQKQQENVEYFSCLGRLMTNDARCARGIEYRIDMKRRHSTGRRLFSPADWT